MQLGFMHGVEGEFVCVYGHYHNNLGKNHGLPGNSGQFFTVKVVCINGNIRSFWLKKLYLCCTCRCFSCSDGERETSIAFIDVKYVASQLFETD